MQPRPLPVIKIGFAMHQAASMAFIEKQLTLIASGYSNEVTTNFGKNLPGVQAQDWASFATGALQSYLNIEQPDLMILEWNLGNAGQEPPSFRAELLAKYPRVRFILVTGTPIPQATLIPYNELGNVSDGLVNNAANLSTVLRTAFADVAMTHVTPLTTRGDDSGIDTEPDHEDRDVPAERELGDIFEPSSSLLGAATKEQKAANQTLSNNAATTTSGNPPISGKGDAGASASGDQSSDTDHQATGEIAERR